MIIMKEFKDVLRFLRTSHNYTQDELSKKLGVSRSRVSMYERGEREPDIETLELLSDFFNVDMNFLLGKSDFTTSVNYYIHPALDVATLSQLTEPNIQKVNTYSRSLLEIQKIELPVLNAAHALSGASKEDSKNDENIMNDENF